MCAFLQKQGILGAAMNNWNEIKTAYMVIKSGTVSVAAQELGVHRATVIRHIDALEQSLGTKLFIRHSYGYLPTEAGKELLKVAEITHEQFNHFASRAKATHSELEGDFVISSLEAISPLLLPAIKGFQENHPKIKINFQSSPEIFKLEYGQAHLAIRTGAKPKEDDYVCLPFFDLGVGLYAHQSYLAKHGCPKNINELIKHNFVGSVTSNAKPLFQQWMHENIPTEQVVFRTENPLVQSKAILTGLGIGGMIHHEAKSQPGLINVCPEQHWIVNNWIVTHGDLHRSEKVQAFLTELKQTHYLEQVNAMLAPQV